MDNTTREIREREAELGLKEDVVEDALPDEGLHLGLPHKQPATPKEWVKENLFSSLLNTILTIVFGLLALVLLYKLTNFIFFTGQWDVFKSNARSYMTGRWPLDEMWRVWTAVYVVAFLGGLGYGASGLRIVWGRTRWMYGGAAGLFALYVFIYVVDTPLVYILTAGIGLSIFVGDRLGRLLGLAISKPLAIAWILMFPLMMVLFRGFDGVPPRLWGGFLLNLTVAFVAIFASFPIGLLLALGRRSTLPAIRLFCIGVIEIVRGNPLYVLLIGGAFLLPLLMPPGMSDIPLIIRAMVIYTLFSSAYVAEIVRGGLQGVDDGQYEASKALGLSATRMMALVILPQALRKTIPAMISHFISLFKDTSLLAVVGGFTDALRAARRAAAAQGEAGNALEALLPAAALFFIIAYSMSRWSQRLEKRLGVGER